MRFSPTLRFTIILLVAAMAGCATPQRAPDLAPAIEVSDSVWWQVDRDIAVESQVAAGLARSFARSQMARWRQLVAQRAEADFIPWFSSYWTQQWLTAKVGWYRLTSEDGAEPPVGRLAAYLQAQYYDRVLAPVAREIDPASVVGQAAKLYIQSLGGQLQTIPRRYDVPQDQFEQRLKGIPAIGLAPPAVHNASLYQIVQAEQIDSLPAYAALVRKIREAEVNAGAGLSKKRISPVAQRVSEKMLDRLAVSGGAGATSALIGGVAGAVFSLGAAGVGVILHEEDRGPIETQLREILDAAMDDVWQILMEDPTAAVTAGVDYLSAQIEKNLPDTLVQPVVPIILPREIPLPD